MDIASLSRLFALAAIWGASFLFMRIGVPVFGPPSLIAFRVSIAAAFLFLASIWLGRKLEFRRHWRHYLIIGGLNSALPFLLYAFAAQTLPASLLVILNATAPLFGALAAAVFLGASITRRIAAGLCAGLAGVAVLVGPDLALAGGAGTAITAALIAALSYGLASTYAKAVPAGAKPVPTPFSNAHGSLWMASLIMLPLLFLAPPRQTPLLADWGAVAALGILCTGAAYLLYFRLIDDVGPTRALSVTFLMPVFGVLWGTIFLDETIGWNTIAGGALILSGIALIGGGSKLPRSHS